MKGRKKDTERLNVYLPGEEKDREDDSEAIF